MALDPPRQELYSMPSIEIPKYIELILVAHFIHLILFYDHPHWCSFLFYGPPLLSGLLFYGPPLCIWSPPRLLINDNSLSNKGLSQNIFPLQ